jgi:probable rRNA maturation factor
MAFHFHSNKNRFKLKNSNTCRAWLKNVLKSESKKEGTISYTFTGDEELLSVNKQFLNHDTFTDIITFDYCKGELVSGEIYISIDRVEENAKKFKMEFQQELQRVMAHGLLHLCGYKDKSKTEIALMRRKEDWALGLFNRLVKK